MIILLLLSLLHTATATAAMESLSIAHQTSVTAATKAAAKSAAITERMFTVTDAQNDLLAIQKRIRTLITTYGKTGFISVIKNPSDGTVMVQTTDENGKPIIPRTILTTNQARLKSFRARQAYEKQNPGGPLQCYTAIPYPSEEPLVYDVAKLYKTYALFQESLHETTNYQKLQKAFRILGINSGAQVAFTHDTVKNIQEDLQALKTKMTNAHIDLTTTHSATDMSWYIISSNNDGKRGHAATGIGGDQTWQNLYDSTVTLSTALTAAITVLNAIFRSCYIVLDTSGKYPRLSNLAQAKLKVLKNYATDFPKQLQSTLLDADLLSAAVTTTTGDPTQQLPSTTRSTLLPSVNNPSGTDSSAPEASDDAPTGDTAITTADSASSDSSTTDDTGDGSTPAPSPIPPYQALNKAFTEFFFSASGPLNCDLSGTYAITIPQSNGSVRTRTIPISALPAAVGRLNNTVQRRISSITSYITRCQKDKAHPLFDPNLSSKAKLTGGLAGNLCSVIQGYRHAAIRGGFDVLVARIGIQYITTMAQKAIPALWQLLATGDNPPVTLAQITTTSTTTPPAIDLTDPAQKDICQQLTTFFDQAQQPQYTKEVEGIVNSADMLQLTYGHYITKNGILWYNDPTGQLAQSCAYNETQTARVLLNNLLVLLMLPNQYAPVSSTGPLAHTLFTLFPATTAQGSGEATAATS